MRLFSAQVCGTEVSLDGSLTSRHKYGFQPGELDHTLTFPYIARFQNEDDGRRSLTGNAFFLCVVRITFKVYRIHEP
jgi:hypothetical protein